MTTSPHRVYGKSLVLTVGVVKERGAGLVEDDSGAIRMKGEFELVINKSYTSHMQTISVSSLKAHLSAELKKIERGERITVLDHKRPVAVLGPVSSESLFVREADVVYECPVLEPLISSDPLRFLADERGDR